MLEISQLTKHLNLAMFTRHVIHSRGLTPSKAYFITTMILEGGHVYRCKVKESKSLELQKFQECTIKQC